jgi:hypothetical protein
VRSCQQTRLHESQLLTLPERVKGETDGPQSGTARVDCLLTGAGNQGEAKSRGGGMIDHVGTAARLTVIALPSAGECLEETDIGIIPAHGCLCRCILCL